MNARPVLVIGATGTLGEKLIPILLEDPHVSRVRVMSRGEHRQGRLKSKLQSNRVDFLLGDVRDKPRVLRASRDCVGVFNLAAIKSVDKAELDPEECIKTNIAGAINVIDACIENKVERVIFTSTDKACAPLNLYGATKLVAEKLFVAGNQGSHNTKFSAVRYGNVLGSQGSVIESWKRGVRDVTDPAMTRFWITPQYAANFVYDSYIVMNGGEVFIPKMKSASIGDLFKAFSEEEPNIIGKRPGEKMHESLLSDDEVQYATHLDEKFILWPSHNTFPVEKYGDPVLGGEHSNEVERLTKDEICQMSQ